MLQASSDRPRRRLIPHPIWTEHAEVKMQGTQDVLFGEDMELYGVSF